MNVLVVCNKFPYPLKDGGAIATFTMIKGFYRAGHTVTVLAMNTSKHYFHIADLPQDVAQMATFIPFQINTDVTITGALQNLLFSCKPYTATRFAHKGFSQKLQEILSKQKFDVVQLEGLYMCYYTPLIRKFSKAKVAYRAHNVEFEIWDRLWRETKSLPKRLYLKNVTARLKKLEIKNLNSYDVLIPITHRDGLRHNELGNCKPSHVVPTGIFTDSIVPLPTEESMSSIFHIGGLDWAPNQQGLVWFIDNCWAKIHEALPDLVFRIAGRNAPEWFVQKLAVPGVEYVGEVNDAKVFMEENTVMIVPLLAGSGMRIKIIEGLSLGKTIIATSIGAEGIPAEHLKEICIANTAEEFSQTIIDIYSSNELRKGIEEQSHEFVKRSFNNDNLIAQLTQFYNDCN